MSSDKAKTERQKIETARRNLNKTRCVFFMVFVFPILEQKIRDKEDQKAVWDGAVLPATSTT